VAKKKTGERTPARKPAAGKESAENYYAGVRHAVHISTNIGTSYKHCNERIGAVGLGDHQLAESINHYIGQHGYKLPHVGTETIDDRDGKPWHTTVAVLGK
jgi:hypothetical protein